MSLRDERCITRKLFFNGWLLFLVYVASSLAILPRDVTIGVIAGGLLVNVNLSFLYRAVENITARGGKSRLWPLLAKYYLSFAVTVAVIYLLISLHLIHELGLLLGLTIFIVNVFVFVIEELGSTILKRANEEAV